VHYRQERRSPRGDDGRWPAGIRNDELHAFYDPASEIDAEVLVDLNSGNAARGGPNIQAGLVLLVKNASLGLHDLSEQECAGLLEGVPTLNANDGRALIWAKQSHCISSKKPANRNGLLKRYQRFTQFCGSRGQSASFR
jgi:hypothetical protein